VKLTTHLHLLPRLKNDYPNTPSWRGAQLKHSDNFTFTFTFIKYEYTKSHGTHRNTDLTGENDAFRKPSQESRSIFSVINRNDEDLWEDPVNSGMRP
jgi:hypothetical protein